MWGFDVGVRDAKPRTAPVARRRDGDIAPYRNGTRGVRTATGRGDMGRVGGGGGAGARVGAWLRGGLGAEGGEASACPCPGEVVAAAKGIDIEGFSGGIEMFDGAAFEGGGFPFVQREAAAGDHCLLQGIGMVDVERKGRAQRGEEEKVLATELAIPAVGSYGGHFTKSLRQRSREKSGKCRPNEAGTMVESFFFEEGAPFFGFGAIGTPG